MGTDRFPGPPDRWPLAKLDKGNEVSQYYQAVETPETEPKCKGTESE